MKTLLLQFLPIYNSSLGNFYVDFPYVNIFYDKLFSYVLFSIFSGLILTILFQIRFNFTSIKENLLLKPRFLTGGFTLIELLVVISIIAVLAVVGITLFSGAQNKARDAKRKSDIIAMSRAMEVNYVAGSGYPTAVSTAWFSDQAIPSNPGPFGASYATNALNGTIFTFCATLENSTGNATSLTGTGLGTTGGGFFCKRNSQ